jgi:NTE family protein
MDREHALVLGGGGIAGIAWHTGMVAGMADAGVDVTGADLIVGTSAGSTVAAQLASGITVEEWFQRQVDPARQGHELRPTGMSVADLWEMMIRVHEETPDPTERRRRIAAMALAADTVPEAVRRQVVAGRLPGVTWPDRRVVIVAVDAQRGDRCEFDAGSGVDLVDAVAASSAVPGVWPPTTIAGRRYIDGGVFSSANADLATGYQTVLVLAPMVDPDLAGQLEQVRARGRAEVVSPDRDALAAFGPDPLDPSIRSTVARAGRAQGAMVAATVAELWNR